MKKGLKEILFGVIFIGLGAFRLYNNEGGLKLWGLFILGFGVFNIARGIQIMKKTEEE